MRDDLFAARGGFTAFLGDAARDLPRTDTCRFHAGKRLFDLTASLGGLLLLLPLFPFLVILIRLDTPGPIFFRQERVGRYGRRFTCWKFRSMVSDAEARKRDISYLNEATGAAFKIKDDPRITGVGRFIRRSSLDEFPQLINVLRGEMSIVGPRPQIPEEVVQYTPRQAARLLVKPGLTCLWQVSGRSQLDFGEWMELDLEYVRRRSLGFDFWILGRTLPAVIERKGAY
jgi:lipopolysaccharide/colanic/teichoic acid biosynthesis glycosyltransferase